MIKQYTGKLVFLVGVILLFSLQSAYSINWITLNPTSIELHPGETASINLIIGGEVKDWRVRIVIPEKPRWLNYTLSRVEGVTPFTSILGIKISQDAILGNHSLKIQLWRGNTLLDEEDLRIIIKPMFTQPILNFINFSCPVSVLVDDKFSLNLSFSYSTLEKVKSRVRIFIDGELETMIELDLVGNGTIPSYRQILAPSEPKEIVVTSILEYLHPENKTWTITDQRICKISVQPIPTIVKLRVNGLPLNLKTQVQILILPKGVLIERTIQGGREYSIDVSISQSSTLLVIVQEEVQASSNIKYVAENYIRELYIEPGWRITLQFSYTPWYLLTREVEPSEEVLRILEVREWVKEGDIVDLSPPKILQTNSIMYILSRIEVDGVEYGFDEVVKISKPHNIRYRYERYYKVSVIFEPVTSSTVIKREDILKVLPSQIAEYLGDYWMKEGEKLQISFRGFTIGDLRFKPLNIESNLIMGRLDGDMIYLVVDKPDTVKLYYNIEAKIKIILRYLDREVTREDWIPIGGEYRILLDKFLNPESIGERIELKNLKSSFRYDYLDDGRELVLRVDSPGFVQLDIERYFLVRVHTVKGVDTIYPICSGPPRVIEWVDLGGVLEAWVYEKTLLTCYFPERIENNIGLIQFIKGSIGNLEITTPGQIAVYVERPLEISMDYKLLRYYKVEGKTDRGLFIGGGRYPEGSHVFWRVEPQEYPADGLMGLLGFKWRALNQSGLEVVYEDKVIKVVWALTPSIDPPIIIFLQLTSIIITSIIIWKLHHMWKSRVKLIEERGEVYEE